MSPQAQSLLEVALALPNAERAELAERLMESIPFNEDGELVEMTEDELLAELERRRADVEAGRMKLIPWEEFRIEE